MNSLFSRFIYGFCYIIFLAPGFLKKGMAVGIGILWFDVLRIRRRVAIENIMASYPDWTRSKATRVARASLINMGITIIEFVDMVFMTPEQLDQRVRIEGFEHLTAALEQGRGAILLGSHVANGDYGIAALSLRAKTHLISKRMTNKAMDEIWFKARSRFGTHFIAPRNSSYDILKALRANETVIFVLDQFMGPPLGVRTTFFGRSTGTAFGLALFAGKTEAVVLPCNAHREPDGKYTVVFEPAIAFEDKGDKKATLQYMTQKYTDKIEEVIRRHPEQWMWIHRRWKVFND